MPATNLNKDVTLIIGIGNVLLGDEGVGIHVIRKLGKQALPPDVELLDGGTGGLQLIGKMQEHQRIIMVDASLDAFEEGAIRVLKPRFASDFPPSLSAHDVGLRDMVEAMALTGNLPEITLIAISIKEIGDLSLELSGPIRAAADRAAQLIVKMLDA